MRGKYRGECEKRDNSRHRHEFSVSVPLRGKYRGESGKLLYPGDFLRGVFEFPSPCGVNIVANYAALLPSVWAMTVSVPLRGKYRGESTNNFSKEFDDLEFPSPCGVNIVANLCSGSQPCYQLLHVSVPLRGKYRGE